MAKGVEERRGEKRKGKKGKREERRGAKESE